MGLNKVQLIGRLKADPVLTSNGNGDLASFTLATNEPYYDAEGKKKELTEWHKVVAFNSRAKVCMKFLRKGSRVYIEGRNNTRKYTKDNVSHFITEIQAKDIQFLDKKG